MENSLSIQNLLSQRNNYNLAIPFVETQQINPYYKLSVFLVYVDASEQASHIFKVGSKNLGNNRFEDLYSLAKPFLQRLATEAGIQFAPGVGDVVKVDNNTWKASAFGALRLPDGSVRTSSNFKVIDLLTEERKYRISYEEKSVSGILDYRAAKAASERYMGEWIDTTHMDNRGNLVKMYKVAEPDRGKYIERSLLDAMAQLRANAPQKAATGAILRVIRDLIGIKGTYTMAELKKPFAVARMSFSPDYNDPVVKQMMLQQCMQSVGNLFGSVPAVTQTISIPQNCDSEDEVDIPAEPMMQVTEDQARESIQKPFIPQELPQREITGVDINVPKNTEKPNTQEKFVQEDFYCDKCDCTIPEKVWKFSVEKYERPLCYSCQKIVREEERGGRRE